MTNATSGASNSLPDYALELAAFHRAFREELRASVGTVPLRAADQVLDVGCGDGFYCELFAERLRHPGGIVGVDANAAYLELAVNRLADVRNCSVDLLQGELRRLREVVREPVDVVWCAQSLFSFPEPEAALRRMAEVVKPGGIVVVLENDTLHQLLLPWPPEIETALRAAELDALRRESPRPEKFYVGRRLPATFAAAGLEPLTYRTQTIDRMGPLDPILELFLKSYLAKLLERVESLLDPAVLKELKDMTLPEGERYLPRQPHFTLTWINVLAWGRAH